MARSNAPIMPPQTARQEGNASAAASGQAATPTNTAPDQPPYGGGTPGAQTTTGGIPTPIQTYVDDAQVAAASYAPPSDSDQAKAYAGLQGENKLHYAFLQSQVADQDIARSQAAYQAAVRQYNDLQAKAAADPSSGILLGDALKNAQLTVDNLWQAFQADLKTRAYWQNEIYQQTPSSDPTEVAVRQAALVDANLKVKTEQLNYDIYAGHARSDADHKTEADALQNEAGAVDLALKQHGLARASVDDAYTDEMRKYGLAAASHQEAVVTGQINYTDGLTEQAKSAAALNYSNASSTAAKTPSEIDVNTSTAAVNTANAANVNAGIGGTTASGQILQQEAAAGYGTEVTKGLQATTAGTEATTAGTRIANAQTEAGPDATFINQLGKAIADPTNPMSSTTAADLYFNHVYGGSQLERKQEANKQASGLLSTMATNGMVVSPGQQYIRGAEPGGTFANVMGRLGNTGYNPQPIHTFSAPAFSQSAGIDISPTQGLPTQSPFTDTGAPNPAFQSPNMAGNAPGFAGQVAGAKQPVVLGNMTPREYHAMRQGGAA